ncbi:MAG: GDSL-type esterase/lipase family protein, partial [Actinomycetia bacterium]|nr:GDSL-type esterase/lipase family protein [Actinomycetes bacterium]
MISKEWVQYTHLEKLYGYLPGMPDAVPAVLGMSAEQHAAAVDRFDRRARHAAEGLLDDPTMAEWVETLPLVAGATVLAVGDSITDDLQSWFEILRHAVDRRRPGHGVRLVNGGLSAHTTAMILRRWPATVTAVRPDLVVCALGGNDVARVGPDPARSAVSPRETLDNMRELHRIATLDGVRSWIWVTPAPVVEHRVAQYPPFRIGQSSWRNDDITALAGRMGEFAEPVVDLTRVFGVPADPALQGPDGVHPTIDGQAAIARAVLAAWAAGPTDPTS